MPAFDGRCFGSSGTAPVSFEADRVSISVMLERGELPGPIDGALAHGGPFVIFISSDNIFHVAMADSIFWQKMVAVGIRDFAALARITRIPVEHELA